MPQKRRRTYIVAYHKDFYNISQNEFGENRELFNETILGKAFPVYTDNIDDVIKRTYITDDIAYVSDNFGKDASRSWFENAGVLFTNGDMMASI